MGLGGFHFLFGESGTGHYPDAFHVKSSGNQIAIEVEYPTATAFFRRALRWFESLGIRCQRVLSDNAKCYASKAFTTFCQDKGIRQSFTRPYRPKTNGKAERFRVWMKRSAFPLVLGR